MKRLKLHWWILLGMLVGAVVGAVMHAAYEPEVVQETALYNAANGVAEIFLKLLQLVVVPLVFFSLTSGILGLGSLAHLGRLGFKTFGLYLLTSMLAITLGLALVNVIRPGVGTNISIPTTAPDKDVPDSVWEVLVEMVPKNFIDAAASFDLLGVIIFTILFGSCLLAVEGEKRQTMERFIESGADVMMRMTGFVISLAPIGIAGLIARMVSTQGLSVFLDLKWYLVTVLLALAGHALVTLPLLMYLTTRRNPYRYLRAMSPALVTGFSTASSNGTLGVTLERVSTAPASRTGWPASCCRSVRRSTWTGRRCTSW